MTTLTSRVISKNPPVTLHEICEIFPKFLKHLLYMATSTLLQNLQEAAAAICSKKFGCPSQESLAKFKEHLFLMTAFKVYHMSREHEEDSWGSENMVRALVGWSELHSIYGKVWGEGLPRKRKISS